MAADFGGRLSALPMSLRVLLENIARCGGESAEEAIQALLRWSGKPADNVVDFFPSRVLMQDFTGVPAVVDLATMRDALQQRGGDPQWVNPHVPVDLVIDHSVMVDSYGSATSYDKNVEQEFLRNQERYRFLKWGQQSFKHFRVVPPGTGICHQVNLEYLAQVVMPHADGRLLFPDTVVGTDSHTTMINGLGVLGWGVGGIEAEAVMLGQPLSFKIPEVVGVRLEGSLAEAVSSTDLVLTITAILREKGVVGKFVEFYGEGVRSLSLADRATLSNMAPEYGATCGYFAIDDETCRYLRLSGRAEAHCVRVEAYARQQHLWGCRQEEQKQVFTSEVVLDLRSVEACLAGPHRPQDRIALRQAKTHFQKSFGQQKDNQQKKNGKIRDGDVVIAAITSCTNTSNPWAMLSAGLLASKAVACGLRTKPWVKTSLAPGSQVVRDYLAHCGFLAPLECLGFHIVGYGCTTCIGNSGPLAAEVEQAIKDDHLCVASVLSGNRNFEGRIHPLVRANYLAAPSLVVAYALAGSMAIDMIHEPLATNSEGQEIFLRDIWPSQHEVQAVLASSLSESMFRRRYRDVFKGSSLWRQLSSSSSVTYDWESDSTYVRAPPFFSDRTSFSDNHVASARALVILGDSVTTDHISPAGALSPSSPAADVFACAKLSMIVILILMGHGAGIMKS